MTRSDRVATLDEAKAQFQKSWDAWKAWAKPEEIDYQSVSPRSAVVRALAAQDKCLAPTNKTAAPGSATKGGN